MTPATMHLPTAPLHPALHLASLPASLTGALPRSFTAAAQRPLGPHRR